MVFKAIRTRATRDGDYSTSPSSGEGIYNFRGEKARGRAGAHGDRIFRLQIDKAKATASKIEIKKWERQEASFEYGQCVRNEGRENVQKRGVFLGVFGEIRVKKGGFLARKAVEKALFGAREGNLAGGGWFSG